MTKAATATMHYTLRWLRQTTTLVCKQFIKGRRVWVWANGLITECKRGHTLHCKSTVTITVTRHYGDNVGVTKPVAAKKDPVYHIRRGPSDAYHPFSCIEGEERLKMLLPWGRVYIWGIKYGSVETYTAPGSNVHCILPKGWEGNSPHVDMQTGVRKWK